MITNFTKIHNAFKLNGKHYTLTALKEVALDFAKQESYKVHIGNFLLDWLNNEDYVVVNTSGSTGIPKAIKLQKQAMIYSAKATGDFFKLEPNHKILHCLPSNFIAGKMMLVRALVLGLDVHIVTPASNPLEGINKEYEFCAMVPLQLENSLKKLYKIKTLIVGGAAVSNTLKNELENLSTRIYATYGMTETITHIAVKALNYSNNSLYYSVLPNIIVKTDERGCLVINAPQLNPKAIVTNDLVTLKSETSFKLLGRYDNIINSGGIKFIPEQIEQKLQHLINSRFFIASENDKQLGERLIIIIEAEENSIDSSVFSVLEKYETPKKIYYLNRFIETATSKINRIETLKLI
ncbi:O-succinylbenzoic acid--CoA ligase [Flavobacteriaceae bacterium AU392]|nr:O-succinylbenzoic acid--CoA ligase [Flavobacteriaceae bacterium]RKM85434.1 O-succinylbenzoic acid--CoA ligase [Flavobacteriaceae bacterium AU392]